ncbi:MAG TPA: carboxypeptidase regulatory-like domain-containing protein [Pyrinomonadaceae bacterium]
MFRRQVLSLVLVLSVLSSSLAGSPPLQAAGGQVAGTVTDPKGALVVGAAVALLDPVSNQTFTAVTDSQGRYQIAGLPAGSYVLTVSARGFRDARRENVRVEEGRAAAADVRLELPAVEETVTATAAAGPSARANADPNYRQLRQKLDSEQFTGDYAVVNNLVLRRDAATFTLRSGELYFLAPVLGRSTGAVFLGDGELSLTPPTETERASLAIFNEKPALSEQFTQLVVRFTDKTFDEVKASPNAAMRVGGAQANRARDLYREYHTMLRKRFRFNVELRALADLYSPERPGFFTAFVTGKRHGKLVFQLDPLGIPEVAPEKVMLMSYGERDGGVWTAFYLAGEYQRRTATSNQDNRLVDITRHEIDGVIRGTQLTASDTVSFRPLRPGTRVLPFELFRSLRVGSVRDERGRELDFVQEGKDEDADFAVLLPEALEVGRTYRVTVQYAGGDAIRDSGGGNFYLLPRSTWYPNAANSGAFGDRAAFRITFRYPKDMTFVGTGRLAEPEKVEGDMKLTHWTSGDVELAVAGFNYGKFKVAEAKDQESGGYEVQFFANRDVPDQIRQLQNKLKTIAGDAPSVAAEAAAIESASTTGAAEQQLAEAQNSIRVFSAFFGRPPYGRLAMTQQPFGNFGQAWPTLVFMPYTAFLDETTRASLFGAQGAADSFWQYVGPHEIAHQWWGHMLGWTSYHDQWMSEGFAEFSASLYVQFVKRDLKKFTDFWEGQRRMIVEPQQATQGRRPYTVGPVTQGYRLNSGKTGSVARFMIYPKGAYILHMLRMMMYDQRAQDPDARFKAMMQDFVKTHFNRDVSTLDFKRIVDKHLTADMDLGGNKRSDWFFAQWVYGKEVPAYQFDYSIGSAGGRATLTGRLTQSGVSDNFTMLVPVWVDYGKGWTRLGAATVVGNSAVDLANVPLAAPPKRVAICALNDVLATSIQNNRR